MLRLLCLLAVIMPRLVLASCETAALAVWPSPDQPLPANGQLVLEAYGDFQEPAARIAERSPRLVAEKHEVPLRVIAIHRGEMRVTQVVLKPERPLQPGKRYTLRLAKPANPKATLLPEMGSWTIAPADVTPPRWGEAPRVTGERVKQFGCGPAVHVDVSTALEDEGAQVQVLAEVTRTRSGETVRFRLSPSEQHVELGHHMCAGGFDLKEGVRYSVRLVALDMAGNESAAPGSALLIQGPRQ
jgi:hypothetical protein